MDQITSGKNQATNGHAINAQVQDTLTDLCQTIELLITPSFSAESGIAEPVAVSAEDAVEKIINFLF